MQTEKPNPRQCVLDRQEAGEKLVPINQIKLLERFHPATRWRWANEGVIPALKMGSRYFSTEGAIAEWLARAPETLADKKARRVREIDQAMENFMKS